MLHLTYCSNVHPGETWAETFASLARYLPAVKQRVAPDRAFGVGLRLSAAAAAELLDTARLREFRAWLKSEDLYVYTLNGFPYGVFHGQPVKDQVFVPDWRTEERLSYTRNLVRVLAALLPEGLRGSISTSPLSYNHWFATSGEREAVRRATALNIARVALDLERREREENRWIQLGLEPEPDGLVETTEELIEYVEATLVPAAAESLGRSLAEAEKLVKRYVGICFDTCHASVQYEDVPRVLDALSTAGVAVTKVQVSAALAASWEGAHAREEVERALASLADPVYLHQVRQRSLDGTLTAFSDLDRALASTGRARAREWRIHFHVPLFTERYGPLASTARDTAEALDLCVARGLTDHFEIETYTWAVLPQALRRDLVASIADEFAWVMKREAFACRDSQSSMSSA